jgi:hypothetical protein
MKYINIIIPSLLLVVSLVSYKYVRELEQCPCFEDNKTDKLNIEFIKFYLLLYIFSVLIHIFLIINYIPLSSLKHTSNFLLLRMLMSLSIFIMFIIHGYMGYTVYHFYQSIKDYCSCATKWQRYFIYYTGITSSLNVLIYIMAFLFIIQVLLIQR